jgi:hypothetical protein
VTYDRDQWHVYLNDWCLWVQLSSKSCIERKKERKKERKRKKEKEK